MKLLLKACCLLTFCSLSLQAQKDTVFIKKSLGQGEFDMDTLFITAGRSSIQVLAGTTFLPYSDKMIELLNHGLAPVDLKIIEECTGNLSKEELENYPQFIAVKREENQLCIEVKVVANCCHNFLGEAEVVNGTTLNLLYTSYGGFCGCQCCFGLRYTFDTTLEKKDQLLQKVTINGSQVWAEVPNH